MSVSEIGSRINAVVYLVLALLFFTFVIIANVSPVEDVLWWPFGPARVPTLKAIHKLAGMTLGTLALLMFIGEAFDARYKKALLGTARTKKDEAEPQGQRTSE